MIERFSIYPITLVSTYSTTTNKSYHNTDKLTQLNHSLNFSNKPTQDGSKIDSDFSSGDVSADITDAEVVEYSDEE